MNIFNSILQKLGIEKPAATSAVTASAVASISAPAKPSAPVQAAPPPVVSAPLADKPTVSEPVASKAVSLPAALATPEPVHPVTVPMVDVVSMLENLAKSHPGADWKVSIADLLMMLGFDYSYEYRKELATELGCPAELMADSARMNVWLHKTVLQKIAENGGNVPASLLN